MIDYDARLAALKDRAAKDEKFGADINQYLGMYTVPIDVFKDEKIDSNTHIDSFTGILLNLNNRYFILSAGHCVKIAISNRIRLKISRTISLPYLLPANTHMRYQLDLDRGIDWGYFEVALPDKRAIEAHDRIFISDKHLSVFTRNNVSENMDMPLLCGFPSKLNAETSNGRSYMLFSMFFGAPRPDGRYEKEDIFSATAGVQSIVHFGSPTDGLSPARNGEPTFDIPPLGGASGCGLWNGAFHASPESWSVEKLSLIAIHSGERYTDSSGNQMRFSYDVLIGHHLRFIADNEPALQDYIIDRWPQLAEKHWSVA